MAILAEERPVQEQATQKEYKKKVGVFEATVLAVNPTNKELETIYGSTRSGDEPNYLGVSPDGNARVRVEFVLKSHKGDILRLRIWVEDKQMKNRAGDKYQFINSVGNSSYGANEESLFSNMTEGGKTVRIAKRGEVELHEFVKTWLMGLNFKSEGASLIIDLNQLFRGNFKELKDLVGQSYTRTVLCVAGIKTGQDGTEHQDVYDKKFMAGTNMKQFKNINYANPAVLKALQEKARFNKKGLDFHERFIAEITGEWGYKQFFDLSEIHDYDPNDNIVSSDKVLVEDDPFF